MTAADDLEVGMWIAVTDEKHSPSDSWQGRRQRPANGVPWEVLAVSLPFVCVKSGDTITSWDVRFFEFQEVSEEYAMLRLGYEFRGEERATETRTEIPDSSRCQRCGTRIVQRLVTNWNREEPAWRRECPECGTEDAG